MHLHPVLLKKVQRRAVHSMNSVSEEGRCELWKMRIFNHCCRCEGKTHVQCMCDPRWYVPHSVWDGRFSVFLTYLHYPRNWKARFSQLKKRVVQSSPSTSSINKSSPIPHKYNFDYKDNIEMQFWRWIWIWHVIWMPMVISNVGKVLVNHEICSLKTSPDLALLADWSRPKSTIVRYRFIVSSLQKNIS